MKKYRMKPVVVEAVQLTADNFDEVCSWIGDDNLADGTSKDECCVDVIGHEDNDLARMGDYIVKEESKGFYCVEPEAFDAGCDPIEETP